MSTALEVTKLTASYDGRPVLWDVDAAFPSGALSAIVGPNGAGKSTLLKAVLGLVPAESGGATIGGRAVKDALREVAYVPQRDEVDWDFPITVREVVEMGRYPAAGWLRRLRPGDRGIVEDALDRVGMAPYAARQIGRLSGGQRQRVFLARALAQEAPLLLMDEPFAGVDARTEAALLDLLGDLRADGRSIVVVHHDLGTVKARFDHALLLNVRTVAEGPVGEVLVADQLRRAYGAGAGDPGDDAPEEELAWVG